MSGGPLISSFSFLIALRIQLEKVYHSIDDLCIMCTFNDSCFSIISMLSCVNKLLLLKAQDLLFDRHLKGKQILLQTNQFIGCFPNQSFLNSSEHHQRIIR